MIIASKKLEYDPESDHDIVKSLMQSQHKSVMRELKNGLYDAKIKLYLPNVKPMGKDDVIPLDSASAPVSVVELDSAPVAMPVSASKPSAMAATADSEPVALVVHEELDITPLPPAIPLDALADESAGATLDNNEADDEAGTSSPYAQLLVGEDKSASIISGVLDSRDDEGDDLEDVDDNDEDEEINGLLSRLKEDSVDQPIPEGDTERAGTWLVSRPGQKERPFDKTGPIAVPIAIPREDGARRIVKPPPSPSHLPEVTPPPAAAAGRTRKNTMPQLPTVGGGTSGVPRRPTPPPTQVNPSKPASGQYSTVRPAPSTRPPSTAASPVSTLTGVLPLPSSQSGTNPPVGPRPPTIPPVVPRPPTVPPSRALTPVPVGPAGSVPQTRAPGPPRPPMSTAVPPINRPPPIPGRSQAIPPVPPRGSGAGSGRPPVGPAPPSRSAQPVTTSPMRAQTVVSPTGGPVRSGVPSAQRTGGRPTPVSGMPPIRRPALSEGVVVARPAVVIGAPPTVIGGPPSDGTSGRRMHGREPTPPPLQPESIFGHDLISEKSLDEVIMAYLSEDSTED